MQKHPVSLLFAILLAWGCRQPELLELEPMPEMSFRQFRKSHEPNRNRRIGKGVSVASSRTETLVPIIGDPGNSPHLAMLKFQKKWFILHENARLGQVKWTGEQPSQEQAPDMVAFFHGPTKRLYGFSENHLMEIDPQKRTMKTIASLPREPFCEMGTNWVEHLHEETDFGWDPDKKGICLVLRSITEPGSPPTITLFLDPKTNNPQLTCSGTNGKKNGESIPCRPVPAATPVRTLPPEILPDPSTCTVRIKDAGAGIISLFAEEDAQAPCMIEFEGKTHGDHTILCVRDPHEEATGRRCVFVDQQSAGLLNVSVSSPAETPVFISTDAKVVLAGGQLLLFNGPGVRLFELPGTALLTR